MAGTDRAVELALTQTQTEYEKAQTAYLSRAQDRAAVIAQAHANGMSWAQIAKAMGLPRSTVSRFAKGV